MKPRIFACIAASLLLFGKVEAADTNPTDQAFLGVRVEALPLKTHSVGALQLKLGPSDGGGLLIRWIVAGSPASKILQDGDVLLALNGEPLVSSAQLGTLLQTVKPGDVITLKVLRALEAHKLEITLKSRPSSIDPPPVTYIERPDILPRDADDPVYDPIQELNSSSLTPRRVWTADQYNYASGKSLAASTSITGQWLRRYCITSSGGRRTLTITDKHDQILFSGPIDSDRERAAVSKKFRAGLKKLEQQENAIVPPGSVTF